VRSKTGSKIVLTLQSIHGILCKADEGHPYPPGVTAAVSFTGSASDMQVSSSTMCVRTGQLVVESNAMDFDKDSTNKRESSDYPMFATFDDPMEGRRSPTSDGSQSTSSSGFSCRPHLTLKMPQKNETSPSVPLGAVNRDSRVVESDGSSSVRSEESREFSRGPSVMWEEGSDMPDIVELHISLRSEDNSICREGIAHLVFFGSQKELGNTTMDLRIKSKGPSNPNAPSKVTDQPLLCFESAACVRVQVEITSEDQPAPSPKHIELSEHFDEQKIGNIMEQLREHEELAAARTKAANFTMNEEAVEKRRPFSKLFCQNGVEFRQTFQAFFEALRPCDGKKRAHRGGIVRMNSTMGSTIATRESLLI
jgi:hypothetical protein